MDGLRFKTNVQNSPIKVTIVWWITNNLRNVYGLLQDSKNEM